MYTKLINLNWKLTTLISNMKLFSDSAQSKLNFESSFVGIHEVMRETWLFEYKFQDRNFGQLLIFWGIKFVNNRFIISINFCRISK